MAEDIASVCQAIIKEGGLPFTAAEGRGNVVDFLALRDDLRAPKVENLVKASGVYFPTIPTGQVSADFSPAYFNLFAQKPAADPQNRDQNNRLVFDTVRDLAATKGQRDDSGHLPPNALTPTSRRWSWRGR